MSEQQISTLESANWEDFVEDLEDNAETYNEMYAKAVTLQTLIRGIEGYNSFDVLSEIEKDTNYTEQEKEIVDKILSKDVYEDKDFIKKLYLQRLHAKKYISAIDTMESFLKQRNRTKSFCTIL